MKELGEKVLGWFVVTEDDAPKVEAPKPKKVEAAPKPAPPPPAGFPQIDARVQKALDLIGALPDGASNDVKRAIVVASLETFGISVDGIVQAAAATEAELDALDARVAEARRQHEELAKSVAREKARLRVIASFFGKSVA